MGGRGCAGQRGVKGGKWDNCNSIINEIYLKKKTKVHSPTLEPERKLPVFIIIFLTYLEGISTLLILNM